MGLTQLEELSMREEKCRNFTHSNLMTTLIEFYEVAKIEYKIMSAKPVRHRQFQLWVDH